MLWKYGADEILSMTKYFWKKCLSAGEVRSKGKMNSTINQMGGFKDLKHDNLTMKTGLFRYCQGHQEELK